MSGCASFSGQAGRPGTAQFAREVGAVGSDWEKLTIQDEALQEAAEVVIGRADLQDLTGLGVPSGKAHMVRWLTSRLHFVQSAPSNGLRQRASGLSFHKQCLASLLVTADCLQETPFSIVGNLLELMMPPECSC